MFDCFKKKLPEVPVKTPEVVPAPPPNQPLPKGMSATLHDEYQTKWANSITRPEYVSEINREVAKLMQPTTRASHYDVSKTTGVPVDVVAVIHSKESSINFKTNLCNGDPLTARTVQVPKGRPVAGNPPFTWFEAAVDALTYEFHAQGLGLPVNYNWDIPGTLFFLEKYNGWGYRSKGINSPYLYSYTNLYSKGRYVKDGVWDPNSVSKAPGCIVLLKALGYKGA